MNIKGGDIKMSNNNGDLMDNKLKRDEKGRILPGGHLAPAKRKRSDIEKLRLALKKEGKNLTPSQGFWDKVAEMAYTDPGIMKAVMNKLTPNKTEIDATIADEQKTIILIEKTYQNCPLSSTKECPIKEKVKLADKSVN